MLNPNGVLLLFVLTVLIIVINDPVNKFIYSVTGPISFLSYLYKLFSPDTLVMFVPHISACSFISSGLYILNFVSLFNAFTATANII